MFNIHGEIRKPVKSKLLEWFKMEEAIAKFQLMLNNSKEIQQFFCQIRKQNQITGIPIRRIQRSCIEVAGKDLLHLFLQNFTLKTKLIHEYFIMLKH